MSSTDRPELQPSGTCLKQRLGPTARWLLKEVERETGRPVVVRQVSIDLHRTYAHIEYASGDQPHTISLVRDVAPLWDYLVAHEAAHALRFFAVPENERLMARIDRQQQRRVSQLLLPRVRERWRQVAGSGAPALPEAHQLATLYQQGLVAQVVNFPADLRIERWIREEHPELRSLQEEALRQNIGELEIGLISAVKETTPPIVYQTATALNAAYCSYIARLLEDPSLVEGHRRAGFGRIGAELAEEVWQTRLQDYTQDRRDTNRWAERFGIRDWFFWRRYPV